MCDNPGHHGISRKDAEFPYLGYMTKDEVVRGNLDLLSEFMRYAFDHPDILDEISPEAELVLLPEDDPGLCAENMRMLEKSEGAERPHVVFRMKKPQVVVPRLESA
ncbi:MAG: hypothetical protein B1H02_01270 [Candidatus Latescibacteria bacterium 4484_107]|nr:MAG: hypothetical protein B1H02_01270 [Candidatus Latescibacteria bacterium 4484_107]